MDAWLPFVAAAGSPRRPYCTLAVTDALPFSVSLQVRVFSPPLEQAPDQIASRPLETLSVIDVPTLNDAVPVLPTGTLMPEGVESTRSPVRPVAVTVNVAVCVGGLTVRMADRVTPLYVADSVTEVAALTCDVAMVTFVAAAPAGTVTVAGTAATALLLLDSDTNTPPDGAAALSVTAPVVDVPPTVDDGFRLSPLSAAGAAVVVCSRTATASRKKSRDVELATLVIRRRKLAFDRLPALQVRARLEAFRLVPSTPRTNSATARFYDHTVCLVESRDEPYAPRLAVVHRAELPDPTVRGVGVVKEVRVR